MQMPLLPGPSLTHLGQETRLMLASFVPCPKASHGKKLLSLLVE